MKKVLSVLLATLMFLTLLMPLSVFAENGPYPIDWDNMTEEDLENVESIASVSLLDIETFDMGYVYPEVMAGVMPVTEKGISYDLKTNTLTLNNFKSNKMLMITDMGDDFKIKLSGYNEVGFIGSVALVWGSSITVTGSGVLVVNKNKTYPSAIDVEVSGTGYGFFKTEKNVALKAIGNIDTELGDAEPTIFVSGTKEADSSKVIMLNGDVKASVSTKKDSVDVVQYVQTEVLLVDEYYGYGDFYTSDEEAYKGKLYICEESYEEALYYVYEVSYDEELKSYVAVYLPELDGIYLADYGFTKVTGDATVPAKILEIDFEPIEMDTCIDENGKECVFIDYSDEESGEDVEVYEILGHSKYGKLALMHNPKTTYKELKVESTEKHYIHYNESTTITVNTIVTKVPGKVTLKKATSAYGGVNVTWNAVSGADSYTIYRKAAGAKSWSTLGTSKTTSYLDKTAKTGTKYTYTVRAKNIVGLGSYDKTGVSTTYIAAPTVKIANATNGIKVSWNKISGATGYKIYRAEYVNGKWTGWKSMGNTNAKTSAWTDKSVKSGVAYKYTVRTISNKLASGYKASSAIRFLSVPTVKIQNASTGVKVTWNKISGAKNYTIYRSEYNASTKKWSSWKNLGTIGAVTSHIDTTASSGVYYKYTVRAVNGGSKGAYKESAQLLYLAQPTTKIANASNGIKVSWTKSAGTKGYTIYRSEYNATTKKWSGWKNMGNTNAKISAWTDKSVKAGVQYKYTVRAVNGNFKSSYKASSALKYLVATKLSYVEVKEGIKLSWNKVPGAKSYVIYRNMNDIGRGSGWTGYTEYKTLDNKTTTWIDKDVVELSVAYAYKVYAVNGDSKSVCVTDSGTIIRTNRGLW